MSVDTTAEYLSIGGNRHTAASCWSSSGLLAFGADQNVALWDPLGQDQRGIRALLHGHNDKVTAVIFLSSDDSNTKEEIVSGSAGGQLLLWRLVDSQWRVIASVQAHLGAINAIAGFKDSRIFATAGANADIKIWRSVGDQLELLISITPKPRFIPLALAIGTFASVDPADGLILIASGTRNDIHCFVLRDLTTAPAADHQAVLKGHEGWIHSLAIKVVNGQELLLASASHDKYVRLWKFQQGDIKRSDTPMKKDEVTYFEQALSAKVQTVSIGSSKYSVTFEALLLGHEDWVYSAAWSSNADSNQLLTASADGSLTIWEADPSSGIWISTTRLGEISGQKGATTATGSSGGFWTGMWSPNGQAVTCLGRTGSWRLWHYHPDRQYWVQVAAISGHISSANGLTWGADGAYVLSTSSDQTTRLHAEWRQDSRRTWHEFSRPQIHGYDLNCLDSTSPHQFVSGADEKLLRVFNEPRDIAGMLRNLAGVQQPVQADLPDAAAIPVLGLSNKAMGEPDDFDVDNPHNRDQDYVAPSVLETSLSDLKEPPTEDLLARHTLWPEHEKLYGHGYEISECAAHAESRLLATACKASSTDHAVIRLYDMDSWTELKPSLTAHSLTVTRLAWSHGPNPYLLSVGRDRQWSIFAPNDAQRRTWSLLQSNAKAHTRMILDCEWCPLAGGSKLFATAGRDKSVKLWTEHASAAGDASNEGNDANPSFSEALTIKRDSSVTAISFCTSGVNRPPNTAVIAVGEESGLISLHVLTLSSTETNDNINLTLIRSVSLPTAHCPRKTVNRLKWRHNAPSNVWHDEEKERLGVAAADGSVRILAIDVGNLLVGADDK